MAKAKRSRLFGTVWQWVAIGLCTAMGAGLFAFVDLTPQVQADFFFSSEDEQFQSSLQIEKKFGDSLQVFVAARSPNLVSRRYLLRLRNLTEDLRNVKGVADAKSLTHGPEEPHEIPEREPEEVFEDLLDSPFWTRLLLAPDRSATLIVLRLKGENHRQTVAAIDRVLAKHDRRDFDLGASGVPYVSEQIRHRLSDDLQRFSLAAIIGFGVLITILFRSLAVLTGTMVAALSATFATFLIRQAVGMETDILMPNLWTIAFVLTLSHVVYLTAEWRRKASKVGSERATRESMRTIGPASLWSLAANLLGFASLILVDAKPLRQFGISGVIAALAAIVCAYTLYPAFLRVAKARPVQPGAIGRRLEAFFTSRHRIIALTTIAAALVLAPFVWQVNTDPSLPSYFAEGDRIRSGISAIDRTGGSSPLDIVVSDASGRRLDDDDAFERLVALQRRLERHKDVGSVISIALLMAETDRQWYSFLFSWDKRLEVLDSAKLDRIGRNFINEDRTEGRFILRMREEARARPRETVVAEIRDIVRRHGFKTVEAGGLYPLQGELSKLVDASVIRGLGGLLVFFFVIVLIVSRSFPNALAMTLCLTITPFILFGIVGLSGMPVDIISAPAANVALPLGIDEMIHLGYTVRRLRGGAKNGWKAWRDALAQMWAPILASMLIVSAGFALFLLSSFPPTQRLGILVWFGAAVTDLVVLVVLPAIVNFRNPKRDRVSPADSKPHAA